MGKHRAGVNPGFLTRHKLKLSGLNNDNSTAIFSEIDTLTGVDSVQIDGMKHTIRVAYDASILHIDEMVRMIRKHGADISTDWWSRFKLKMFRQNDLNIRDSANSRPSCCNRSPTER